MIQWISPLGHAKALNILSSNSLFKYLDSTSAKSMNRAGERGSPCLTPLAEWKKPEAWPLISTEYQLLDSRFHTMLMKHYANPIFLKTCIKYFQETLSYAFAMSSLITTLAGFPLNLMSVTISWVNKMFSNILLPLINPDWMKEIKEGSIFSSLSWTTLDITLLIKLLKLISLRSVNVWTCVFLAARQGLCAL